MKCYFCLSNKGTIIVNLRKHNLLQFTHTGPNKYINLTKDASLLNQSPLHILSADRPFKDFYEENEDLKYDSQVTLKLKPNIEDTPNYVQQNAEYITLTSQRPLAVSNRSCFPIGPFINQSLSPPFSNHSFIWPRKKTHKIHASPFPLRSFEDQGGNNFVGNVTTDISVNKNYYNNIINDQNNNDKCETEKKMFNKNANHFTTRKGCDDRNNQAAAVQRSAVKQMRSQHNSDQEKQSTSQVEKNENHKHLKKNKQRAASTWEKDINYLTDESCSPEVQSPHVTSKYFLSVPDTKV